MKKRDGGRERGKRDKKQGLGYRSPKLVLIVYHQCLFLLCHNQKVFVLYPIRVPIIVLVPHQRNSCFIGLPPESLFYFCPHQRAYYSICVCSLSPLSYFCSIIKSVALFRLRDCSISVQSESLLFYFCSHKLLFTIPFIVYTWFCLLTY